MYKLLGINKDNNITLNTCAILKRNRVQMEKNVMFFLFVCMLFTCFQNEVVAFDPADICSKLGNTLMSYFLVSYLCRLYIYIILLKNCI